MEQAVLGEIVYYVLPEGWTKGEVRPAVVVSVDENQPNKCNLQVFMDGPRDEAQLSWRSEVIYDAKGTPGTWHHQTDRGIPLRTAIKY